MQRVFYSLIVLCLVAGTAVAQIEGLDALRHRGYLRLCADPANVPFSSDQTATPGFEVELAQLLARQLGLELRPHWQSTLVRPLKPLREGLCDMFMGLPTDARFRDDNPWVVVSRPYYVMSHGLVVRADAGADTIEALMGKRVAVEAGSVADSYAFYNGLERGLYKRQAEIFGAVVAGDAAAALLWLPVANWLAREHAALRVIPLTGPNLEFAIGAGVRRRDRGLAEAVDQALRQLQESGAIQQVLERYGAVARAPAVAPSAAVGAPQDQPASQTGNASAGRSLFSTMCSRCHGAEGVGGGEGGVVPKLRNYDGGQERFVRLVQQGKKGTPMAAFKSILSDEEILSIYQYLTSLPRQ